MSEKLFDMKPIRWNSPSSCCCNRTAPVVKLDASHSRQKGPDLDGKASVGAEVMVLFSASQACWLWSVCDSLDLNKVHCYMVLRDNKPKVVHLLMFELAFLQSEE